MAQVRALRPIREAGVDYKVGEVFDAPDERAQRLFDLQMVVLLPGDPVPTQADPPKPAPKAMSTASVPRSVLKAATGRRGK